jgi:hypothetical protein
MAHDYFNDDPRYQLMATIIANSNVFGGDAEVFKEDYIEILRLCYTYTIDHKWMAQDLAHAIVAHLSSAWDMPDDFESYAEKYWTPSSRSSAEAAPEVEDGALIP